MISIIILSFITMVSSIEEVICLERLGGDKLRFTLLYKTVIKIAGSLQSVISLSAVKREYNIIV